MTDVAAAEEPTGTSDPVEALVGELDGDPMQLFAYEAVDSLVAIAAWCGVEEPTAMVVITEVLDDRSLFPTGAALVDLLTTIPDATIDGLEGFGPPRWFPFDPRDPDSAVPLVAWVGVPAGGLLEEGSGPLAFRIGLGPMGTMLEVFGGPDAGDLPARALVEVVERRRRLHPLRGQVVRVGGTAGNLVYRLVLPREVDRSRVVLPSGTWEVLDRHVGAFLHSGERLGRLGMGMHVGVLLSGAPGTGKTAVCRVLAEELRGEATVLFVDPITARDALSDLYALASLLAPTLVVIEHVEAAGPIRGSDAPTALAQFLTAVDLADDAIGPVVTVFTTSEVGAVDASVRVGGRLHCSVELTVPDLGARRRIIEGLLAAADGTVEGAGQVDVAAVARVTEGATGADLHHIVRLALLEADGPITTQRLLARARAGGWTAGDTGLYL